MPGLTRVLESQLRGGSRTDRATFVAVPAILAAVALRGDKGVGSPAAARATGCPPAAPAVPAPDTRAFVRRSAYPGNVLCGKEMRARSHWAQVVPRATVISIPETEHTMRTFLVLMALALVATPARAQSAADSTAIHAASLDYIEGWYTGDAARMERALHPELAKRIIPRGPDGRAGALRNMSAAELVEGTRRGGGSRTPAERRRTEVTILDVYENVASVRVDADRWIDYMHLARTEDGWKIINVLWEYRPQVGG